MSTTTVKGNFVRFRYWFTPISSSKKKRNFKHLPTILLLFTVLAVIIPLWVSGNQIKFERVSLKDGLSQSAVFSILQDRQGFMWFATQEGLNKYNGYDFKVFKHRIDEPESLSDNWINVIFEDSHGDLWVGTADGGLDKFDRSGEEFIHYQHQPQNVGSISDDHILTIYEDSRETLWIGTNQGGLNRFNRRREEFIRYTPEATNPNSLSHDKVTAICEDNSGALWIGTHGGGLNKLTRKSSANTDSVFFQHFRHQSDNPNSLSSDRVLSLHWEQSGYLWIGTNGGGLDKYNPRTGKFTHYLARPGEDGSLTDNRIYKIFQDREGTLWVGTENGLNRYLPDQDHFLQILNDPTDEASLSHNQVRDIYEDRSGILWVATYGGGVNKYNKNITFRNYNKVPGNPKSLIDNMIWSILEDRQNRLWIGTNNGLDAFDSHTGEFTHHVHDLQNSHTLSHNVVRTLVEDHRGRIWAGTDGGGLNLIVPKVTATAPEPDTTSSDAGFTSNEHHQFLHFFHDPSDPTSLSDDRVRALFEDSHNIMWIGTWNGLNRLDLNAYSGRFVSYHHDPSKVHSLSDNRVRSLYEDRNGELWVGTYGGLNLFKREENKFISFRHHPENEYSLSNDRVLCIYEDQKGRLWIGTYGGGLNRFDREEFIFYRYTMEDGLPNSTIYGILEDDAGNLWLSTNNGLSKFNPDKETFKNYDVNDGLQSNEFNGGAYYRRENGEMVFGGINGFTMFFPEKVRDNKHVPPVAITAFKKYDKTVEFKKTLSELKKIELTYKDNFFSFEFASLDYTNPEKNQYAYKLEGFDRDWIYSGNRHYASYTNLNGGNYTFRVKGSNNDGIWNEKGASIKIRIIPPFWETTWFKLLLGTVIILFGYLIYRMRVRTINIRNKKLEQEVVQRTCELNKRNHQLLQSMKETDDILNNVEEGLFLLNTELKIGVQYSAALGKILENKNLARKNFLSVLARRVPDTTIEETKEFLLLMFKEHVDEESLWELNPLSKIEFHFSDGNGSWQNSKHLAFNFKRVFDQDNIINLIVTVADITEQVLLAERLVQTEEQNKKQMEWLVNILHVEPKLLNEFIEGVQAELDYIDMLLKNSENCTDLHIVLKKMFRSMHLIKGNASLLDLKFFSNTAHQFEEKIVEVQQKSRIQGKHFVPLVLKLSEMCQNLLEIKKLIARISQIHKHFRPVNSSEDEFLLKSLNNLVTNLSKELEKDVQFQVDDFTTADIPYRYRLLVKEISIQLIRNAMHHGIEPGEERAASGKATVGTISLLSTRINGKFQFKVRDDGRGLQVDELKKRALASNRWSKQEIESWTEKQLAQLIFESGFSTVKGTNLIAGRGVGMDLIKSRLEKCKGHIDIDFEPGKFCEFTVSIPIPEEAYTDSEIKAVQNRTVTDEV